MLWERLVPHLADQRGAGAGQMSPAWKVLHPTWVHPTWHAELHLPKQTDTNTHNGELDDEPGMGVPQETLMTIHIPRDMYQHHDMQHGPGPWPALHIDDIMHDISYDQHATCILTVLM